MDVFPRIREAGTADAIALSVLGAATMLETYAELLPGHDLLRHIATRHDPQTYSAWLQTPAVTIWIAVSATLCPVGYVVLTPATLPEDAPRPNDMEIQRIYVLSRYHGTDLGRRLMRHALDKAGQAGADRVVLGVHNNNARALAFYRRQGFVRVGSRVFQVGGTQCDDSILAREMLDVVPAPTPWGARETP